MVEHFVHTIFGITLFTNAAFFIPQIISLIKAKSTKAVSLTMFLGFNAGQIFSIWHAYYTKDYIFLIGSFVTLLVCGTVTTIIVYYRMHGK